MRIIGNPRYPNSAGSPASVAAVLDSLRRLPGHEFWKDEISLIDSDVVDVARVTTPHQVTDTYLLALAVTKNGQLATFDRRLATAAVRRGREALHIIDGR
jgi:predicted nucleic acid-binding protein